MVTIIFVLRIAHTISYNTGLSLYALTSSSSFCRTKMLQIYEATDIQTDKKYGSTFEDCKLRADVKCLHKHHGHHQNSCIVGLHSGHPGDARRPRSRTVCNILNTSYVNQ